MAVCSPSARVWNSHRSRIAITSHLRLCGGSVTENAAGRVEDPAERVNTNTAATIGFTVVSGSAGSVMASSRADDQRVLLRASKLLHHVLACQRLPYRPERFLIDQPHGTPARGVLRATAAVVRPFARTRVSRIAGVQRAVRATDDVDEVHTPIVAGAAPSEMPAAEQKVSGVRQVVTVIGDRRQPVLEVMA